MNLETDVLQVGFKKTSSTAIYTSMLKETFEYYNENKMIAIYDCWMP